MRIIALINQKGGVGKTTTTANLGAGLARLGKKVLLIDIDPQANLSLHLDVDVFKSNRSVYDLLLGHAGVGEVIRPTSEEGLFIIPSHIDLCSAELELVNTVGREMILRDALVQYTQEMDQPFDYILIDCPPSLGLLSLNALTFAKEVIIPIQAEFFALQGMGKLVDVVRMVTSRINADLSITGIVVCMYRSQTTLAREVLAEVKSFFGDIVYDAKIRVNIKLAEAPGHGKSIFGYEMDSNGALDYMALSREVAGLPPEEPEEEEEDLEEEDFEDVGDEEEDDEYEYVYIDEEDDVEGDDEGDDEANRDRAPLESKPQPDEREARHVPVVAGNEEERGSPSPLEDSEQVGRVDSNSERIDSSPLRSEYHPANPESKPPHANDRISTNLPNTEGRPRASEADPNAAKGVFISRTARDFTAIGSFGSGPHPAGNFEIGSGSSDESKGPGAADRGQGDKALRPRQGPVRPQE